MTHDETVIGDCWVICSDWTLQPVRVSAVCTTKTTVVQYANGKSQHVDNSSLFTTKAIGRRMLLSRLRNQIDKKEGELEELYVALAKAQEL